MNREQVGRRLATGDGAGTIDQPQEHDVSDGWPPRLWVFFVLGAYTLGAVSLTFHKASPMWVGVQVVAISVMGVNAGLGWLREMGFWPAWACAAGRSVRGLTSLAALLAGRAGPALYDEWNAHLAGESGHDPLGWPKVKAAAGFAVAGIKCRCSDWADTAWKPAEVVLRSRTLSNLLVMVPTIVVAVVVLTHKGTVTAMIAFGSIFGVGTALAKLVAAGREYRGVKPPPSNAHRASKNDQDI